MAALKALILSQRFNSTESFSRVMVHYARHFGYTFKVKTENAGRGFRKLKHSIEWMGGLHVI